MKNRTLTLMLFVAAALLIAAGTTTAEKVTMTPLCFAAGQCIDIEVALTQTERKRGLMERPFLASDKGMLLVFNKLGHHAIWMKNMEFGLDLLWIDQNKKIVHIFLNATPCGDRKCPQIQSLHKSLYVLEIPAGKAAEYGLQVGQTLTWSF